MVYNTSQKSNCASLLRLFIYSVFEIKTSIPYFGHNQCCRRRSDSVQTINDLQLISHLIAYNNYSLFLVLWFHDWSNKHKVRRTCVPCLALSHLLCSGFPKMSKLKTTNSCVAIWTGERSSYSVTKLYNHFWKIHIICVQNFLRHTVPIIIYMSRQSR